MDPQGASIQGQHFLEFKVININENLSKGILKVKFLAAKICQEYDTERKRAVLNPGSK
jgi:hypothetical protein